MAYKVEVFLSEKGARNCTIVGETFCVFFAVLAICRHCRLGIPESIGRALRTHLEQVKLTVAIFMLNISRQRQQRQRR